MENLALTFASGWGSGLNSYLVVLVLGIAERVSDTDRIPHALGSWPVLLVAGLLYALEFVGDKIPYVDSAWDGVSTFIRPVVGAVIGVLLAGDASSLDQAVLAAVGGGSALASHTVKAGSRLAVNASPEPFTNIGMSLGEDGLVLSVITLAVHHPHLAAAIAAVLLVAGLVLVGLLARTIRRGWRRWKAKDGVEPLFRWQRTSHGSGA